MQAHLAADRAEGNGCGVLHLAPDKHGLHSFQAFLDQLPAGSAANRIRSFEAGDDAVRGQSAGVVIVDQPHHIPSAYFREVYGPIRATTPDVEWVLAATGENVLKGGETALAVAMEVGDFSLIWSDLVAGIHRFHNDPDDFADYFKSLP